MPERAQNLDGGLARALASAAVSRELRSVLVFDAEPDAVRALAVLLRLFLQAATGAEVRTVGLGAVDDEDRLWGQFSLSAPGEGPPFAWRPGLLADEPGALKLLVLPDLTLISLTVARAGVALLGADVAHLERHGQQAVWRPDLCWLAGCERSAIGQLSPHLLDRFALRLQGKDLPPPGRGAGEDWTAAASGPWPQTWSFQPSDLRRALDAPAEFTPAAGERVLRYLSGGGHQGSRRELALARLAHAHARLLGEARVTAEHVAEAAELIGLAEPAASIVSPPPPTPSPPPPHPDPKGSELPPPTPPDDPAGVIPTPAGLAGAPSGTGDFAVVTPGPSDPTPSRALLSGTALSHPEDGAPVEREPAGLKLPAPATRGRRPARGAIVGVERAADLHDLALTSTLFEAAKFRELRRKEAGEAKPGRFRIFASDWRRYRRAPLPEQLLVLVLDHTCLRDGRRDWEAALIPYLHAAYLARAAIHVAQVGRDDGGGGLRARLVKARSLLAREVARALDLKPGRATPLAHGLELALQTMRHALHHGRNPAARCTLVVVSDGRGNVPLGASQTGRPPGPVGRQGVEDALSQARRIAGLSRVRAVLLDPQPPLLPELPGQLAQALGASVHPIPFVSANEERRP